MKFERLDKTERFKPPTNPVFEAYNFHQGAHKEKRNLVIVPLAPEAYGFHQRAAGAVPQECRLPPRPTPNGIVQDHSKFPRRKSEDALEESTVFQRALNNSRTGSLRNLTEQLQSYSSMEAAGNAQRMLLEPRSPSAIIMDRLYGTVRSGLDFLPSPSLDGATRLTTGGVFAALIGRATQNPTTSELKALVMGAPSSAWGGIRDLDRTKLQNLASWEHAAFCKGRYPGANALLSKVQSRGAISALGVLGFATAINYSLDRAAFPHAQNGLSTNAFDVVGAGFIAGMPLRMSPAIGIPLRLTVIALGHQLARRVDATLNPQSIY